MHIHNLIEKLRELEAMNPNFQCSIHMHDTESDGVDQHLHSDELPEFAFLDNDPNSVMIDFYTADWQHERKD